MTWRVVAITNRAKLSYKNDYLLVRNETLNMIHMSEIGTLIVDSTAVSITTYLLCELANRKIKVIFCDERRNPVSELVPYYGSHNSSKKIHYQVKWADDLKKHIWTNIVRQKIVNQAKHLVKLEKKEANQLLDYVADIAFNDETNREGHAAKVYFNALFGKGFSRDDDCNINAALDYGYSILLSSFNKEVVAKGYLTQLGIKHKNEFNFFNLSCDLMEPFRILVDEYVYQTREMPFTELRKMELVNLINKQVSFAGKDYYLSNAIHQYVRFFFNAMEKQDINELKSFDFI